MKKRLLLSLTGFFMISLAFAQARLHAHNDYLQPRPFYDAIAVKAFSIEADIFLRGDSLLVAHSIKEIVPGNTLEKLYLKPIQGFYASPDFYSFQLMIDVKGSWEETYPALLKLLNRYKKMFVSEFKRVNIVISGNRPPAESFRTYPDFIHFDGLPGKNYAAADLNKVLMISDDFSKYTSWKGIGGIPEEDKAGFLRAVSEARLNRKFLRFWNTPDNEACWKFLYEIGAYVINTDKLKNARDFFSKLN